MRKIKIKFGKSVDISQNESYSKYNINVEKISTILSLNKRARGW